MKKIILSLIGAALFVTANAAAPSNSQSSNQQQTQQKTTTTTSSSNSKSTSSTNSSTSYKSDFEDGKTTNWSASSLSQNVKVEKGNQYSGSYSLNLSDSATIDREIKLSAGTYIISAYTMLVSGNSSDAVMRIYEKSQKGNTYTQIAGEQIKSSKKYGETKSTIKLKEDTTIKITFATGKNTEIRVDDIDITKKK
ncbi:MAG: carbohydrate binding domain-containing protein [Rikenellaceae bacterium]